MACEAQQIFSWDFNKSAAVGVDIPFNASGVFRSNYTTKQAIKNNLINYFLTNPGERPLNPTFGGGLRAFIFEQIANENLSLLKETIQANLVKFFSSISILNLEILKNKDENNINIQLSYSVNNTNIQDTLELTFA